MLFRRDAKARTSHVELHAQTIGRNVGHGAQHPCSAHRRHGEVAQLLQEGGVGPAAACAQQMLGAPTQTRGGHGHVGAHANEDAGALAGQNVVAEAPGCFTSRLKDQQLLREAFLEIMGRKAHACGVDDDVLQRRGAHAEGMVHGAVGPDAYGHRGHDQGRQRHFCHFQRFRNDE